MSSKVSKQSDLPQSSPSEDDLVENSVSFEAKRRKGGELERRGLSGERRRGEERGEERAAPSDHLDGNGFSRDVVLS